CAITRSTTVLEESAHLMEVKPVKPNTNPLFSDLRKLGNEMKDIIDKCIEDGIYDDRLKIYNITYQQMESTSNRSVVICGLCLLDFVHSYVYLVTIPSSDSLCLIL
ncbi:7063_t:CDS:2, partial [Entrophospora sp. SA101]